MVILPKNKIPRVIVITLTIIIIGIFVNYVIFLLYNHTTLLDFKENKNEVLIKVVPFDKSFYEFEFSVIKEKGVKISKKVNQNYIYEVRVEDPIEFKSKLKREYGDGTISLEIWDQRGLKLRENLERNNDEIKVDVDFKKTIN